MVENFIKELTIKSFGYESQAMIIYHTTETIQKLNPNQLVSFYLMASYLHYCEFVDIMDDSAFDNIGMRLHDEWDDVNHQHKSIIDRWSCSFTGHSELEIDYPLIVIGAARQYARDLDKRDRELSILGNNL